MKEETKIEKLAQIPQRALDEFNENEMDGLPPLSGTDALAIGVGWTAIGMLLINVEINKVPWISLLGWLAMALGLICVLCAAVIVHQQKPK